MDFLARETVAFPEGFWDSLDKTVVNSVKQNLTGRKFLPLYGPLGAGASNVQVDEVSVDGSSEEEESSGLVKRAGRTFVELPQIFEDFTFNWRDIESSEKSGFPLDFTKATLAAQRLAIKEDSLIFFGSEFLGSEGLLTASGTTTLKRGDWAEGENAFLDVAKGLAEFRSKGIIGRYSLILSTDLYAKLYRIQPSLGIIEIDRISKMLDGNLFQSPALGKDKAVLVCAEAQYMDLAVGLDILTGYLETKDFNHVLRIMETAALRLKCKDAVIKFE